MSDYDEDSVDSSNSLNILIYGGYFVIDNFELELGISFIRQESGGNELKNYGLIPMINYHLPITERINLVSGIGIKWEKQEYNAGSYAEFDSFGYGIKVGFEFFMIPNAAITVDASYWRHAWNFDPDYDDVNENRFTIPLVGIKLYF
jgi:hypothetical protein